MGSELTAATDVGVFADRVLGAPLWTHQLEFARCAAKVRVVNAGRQVGKSQVLAVTSLYEAATRANIFVLVLSAGEAASRRLLAMCARLAARSDLLRGSVLDESKSTLLFTNGSQIMSIPASERQARGWSADVLVLDEAAFIGEDIFNAVEPVTIARPGSRIVLASTPFSTDHFFYRLWQRGMLTPDERYASFHWPSSISPLISELDLADLRERTNPLIFAREYEAQFTDSQSALLSPEEISRAVVDYEMVEPDRVDGQHGYWAGLPVRYNEWTIPPAVAGIDWGKAQDADALVLVGVLDDNGVNVQEVTDKHAGDYVFFIPWLESHYRMDYGTFIDRIITVCGGYHVRTLASELNGVGAYPTEELWNRLYRANADGKIQKWRDYIPYVAGVWTDNRRKQAMYGRLKGMLQSGKLVLPRHPELLSQLGGLEMTLTAAGNTQISVPESKGHDDIVDALGHALSSIGNMSRDPRQRYRLRPTDRPAEAFKTLESGLLVPANLRLLDPAGWNTLFRGPHGEEKSMPW